MFVPHQLLHYFIKKSSIYKLWGHFFSHGIDLLSMNISWALTTQEKPFYTCGQPHESTQSLTPRGSPYEQGRFYWQIIHVPIPPFPVVPGREGSFFFQVSATCHLVPRSSWRDFRLSLICFFFLLKKFIYFFWLCWVFVLHSDFFSSCSEQGLLSSWAGRASLIAEWGL